MLGFSRSFTGQTVGASFVCRPFARHSADGRAQARVRVWDDTNDAEIVDFDGPKYIGTHDGAGNSATLTDSTARWPQSLVGATLYNITDGSSTTVTAVSGDGQTLTGVLSGGTDNDWDASDQYRIVWDKPWVEPFCYSLPTTVGGAASDCTDYTIYIFNQGAGEIFFQQVEIFDNVLPNGSFATGAGDPWIPEDWTNNNLPVGGGEQETSIVHSGGSSVQFNTFGNSQRNFQKNSIVPAGGAYTAFGCWRYGATTGPWGALYVSNGSEQKSSGSFFGNIQQDSGDVWQHLVGVCRVDVGTPREFRVVNGLTFTGPIYADDYYMIALDAVSVTVTPATEANSTEGTGLRIDGLDQFTQPVTTITEAAGSIQFNFTPRHDYADWPDFGWPNPFIFFLFESATDRVYIQHNSSTRLRVTHQSSAGGFTHADWNSPIVLNAKTTYLFEVQYETGEDLVLLVDGVEKARSAAAIPNDMDGVPTTMYWGTDSNGNNQVDATFDEVA